MLSNIIDLTGPDFTPGPPADTDAGTRRSDHVVRLKSEFANN